MLSIIHAKMSSALTNAAPEYMLPSANVGSSYIEYLVVMTVHPGRLPSVCSPLTSPSVCPKTCDVSQLKPVLRDFSNIVKHELEGVLRFEVHYVDESNSLFFTYLWVFSFLGLPELMNN